MNKQMKSSKRTLHTEKLLKIGSVVLLAFSAVSLFNAFRLDRTASALLNSLNAAPPSIIWYEEADVQTETTEIPVGLSAALQGGNTYVLNTSSKKIHSPICRYAQSMQESNKQVTQGKSLEELLAEGYSICSVCHAE